MGVHNISTMEDFEIVIKQNRLVVLDAFATWCGPCKAIAPTIAKWSNQDDLKDVFFAKFDVDELPGLAQTLGVRAMPTFMIFRDGEKDEELVGANPQGLLALINNKVGLVAASAPAAAPEPAAASAEGTAAEETKPADA